MGTFIARPRGGHNKLVKMLLEAEANINLGLGYNGYNALFFAARHCYTDVVATLLKYNISVSSAHSFKWYPIHQAAMNGHFGLLKLLVEHDPGCVNPQDEHGLIPLDLAALSKGDN